MNLKESYRYANYLDALFNRAMNYLLDDNFITGYVVERNVYELL